MLADDIARRFFPDLDLSLNYAQDHLLHARGFVKLQQFEDNPHHWRAYGPRGGENWSRVTQRQRDTIFDWCQKHGKTLPAEMAPDYCPEPDALVC